MLWWIVPVSIVVMTVMYVLFARLFVAIDSSAGTASVRFSRLAEISLTFNETLQVVRLKIGWWHKEYNMLQTEKYDELVQASKSDNAKPRTKSDHNSIRLREIIPKIIGVVRSFKIRKCNISIDTGDMPLNGILFPWFYLLMLRTGRSIKINFVGENIIILEAENTIARMLWAYIKS